MKLSVPNKYKMAIYNAYVYSKIRYGIEIYAFQSTNQLHKGLDILQINDIYKASVLKFVFRCVNHTS